MLTCSVCNRPIQPGEITAVTGFGLTCQICVESGDRCAPIDYEGGNDG